MKTSVAITLTDRVQQQIQYLCYQSPNREWSGILFYSTHGKFGHQDFQCVAEDIFLMDIGDEVYTEYLYNPEVVAYMLEHPALLDCKKGHIHSHHSMPVFFSPVDTGELHTNAPNHNFYLSLIVNNAGDIEAKIAFVADVIKTTQEKMCFRDENGEWAEQTNLQEEVAQRRLCIFSTQIISSNYGVTGDFIARFKKIAAVCTTVSRRKNRQGRQLLSAVEEDCDQTQRRDMIEKYLGALLQSTLIADEPLTAIIEKLQNHKSQRAKLKAIRLDIAENARTVYQFYFPADTSMAGFETTLAECKDMLWHLRKKYKVASTLAPYFNLSIN